MNQNRAAGVYGDRKEVKDKIATHLIENGEERERAVLVSAPGPGVTAADAREHLEELASLTDTAGGLVVDTVRQRLNAPHPGHYIGTGKVDELRSVVSAHDAGLVIFDEELTPAQGQNLEESVGVRVMDRSELIIDIFALRARTAEAKAQVELAQLEYLLPRLTRMWNHLSRIRGGIGLRGPGETQLETDRRIIGRKIAELKKRLDRVARQRETQRKGRTSDFRVALIGYTNAGKSSILAGLSGSDLFIEDRLFATLDPATRAVDLGSGYQSLVTDTVGFIRKLPHHLVASFGATLEEAGEADVLCHIVDVAHPQWEERYEIVEGVLRELGVHAKKDGLIVFNKVDRLTHAEEAAIRARATAMLGSHVFTSTREPQGLESLRDALREAIRRRWPAVSLTISAADGSALAEVYREGEVLAREQQGARIQMTARLPEDVLGRLKSRGSVAITDPPAA